MMPTKSWTTIDAFLNENDLEFTFVDSEESYQEEVRKINKNLKELKDHLTGKRQGDHSCKRYIPVKKRILRKVNGRFELYEYTEWVCAE
jgi:hypothetical protein